MSAKSPNQVSEPDSALETMASVVYRKLRTDILTGKLQPGGRLRIELLTERYGVGASPTREALNRLSAESFVRRHDQRGFQVAPVSMAELRELIRTRCLLNEVVLREAITRGDMAWEDQIILTGNRLKRTESILPDGSPNPIWEDRHRAFHAALYAACDSRWLIEMMETLFDCADRYRHLSIKAGPNTRDTVGEHQALMDAVLDRDVDTAIRLLNEHIALTGEVISNSTFDVIAAEGAPAPAPAPAARRKPTRRARRPRGAHE
jgi:DNA-binding GntR family transcriptional regulator